MRHTYLWLAQLSSGLVILALIGIHVIAQHPNGIMLILGWFSSALSSALSTWASGAKLNLGAGLYAAIIILGLFHGANGLRGIVAETSAARPAKRMVTLIIIAVGVVLAAILIALLLTAKV